MRGRRDLKCDVAVVTVQGEKDTLLFLPFPLFFPSLAVTTSGYTLAV